MSSSISSQSRILIVGAGAWGLSTALHLNASGYSNVTVFDRSETIPSRYSAANDLNKIVRAEYEDPFYADLALEAMEGWRTPLFGPYYHQTGYVVATTGSAPRKATSHLNKALSTISSHPAFAKDLRPLNNPDDFREYTWQYTGPLTGFTGYFNRRAGYAHSGDALSGIYQHCSKRGVKFVLGETTGEMQNLLYEEVVSTSNAAPKAKCVGILSADGKIHDADVVICALGAHNMTLIPSLAKFAVARCWSVAHVQLSESEANWLRGIPTTNVRDLGFFFEPDPKTKLFKICPLGPGIANRDTEGTSLPPHNLFALDNNHIPASDWAKLRRLLRETFPWMADRPFVETKMCWFADTIDSEFCIDFVPNTDNSLVVLSGDSGHGFKMMPIFGKWVVDLLERGNQNLQRWKWKDVDVRSDKWDAAVSWRIGEGMEWSDLLKEAERVRCAKH